MNIATDPTLPDVNSAGTLAKIDFRQFWNRVLETGQKESGGEGGRCECLKMGTAGSGLARRKEEPISQLEEDLLLSEFRDQERTHFQPTGHRSSRHTQ